MDECVTLHLSSSSISLFYTKCYTSCVSCVCRPFYFVANFFRLFLLLYSSFFKKNIIHSTLPSSFPSRTKKNKKMFLYFFWTQLTSFICFVAVKPRFHLHEEIFSLYLFCIFFFNFSLLLLLWRSFSYARAIHYTYNIFFCYHLKVNSFTSISDM